MSWINCSFHLPEEGQRVLGAISTCTEGIQMDVVELRYTSENNNCANNKTSYKWHGRGPMYYFGQSITHWRPLPDPPKVDLGEI